MYLQKLIHDLKNRQRRIGFVSYSMVLLIAMISVLIVSLIQSRLLLSVYRRQSLSDTLINEYAAESEIYDIFTRVVTYSATFPPDYTQPLVDGTQLTVDTEEDPVTHDQAVTVTARRPYAVTILRGERSQTVTTVIDRVEIILSLDCTGSMNSDSGTGASTRFDELKNATLAFIDAVETNPDHARFYVGLSVFGLDAAWVDANPIAPTGDYLVPTNDMTRVRNAVTQGFGSTQSTSPACNPLMDTTSIGSGFAFSRDYFKNNPIPPPESVKRIQLLVTDGEPNARMPYADCDGASFSPPYFCPFIRYHCPGRYLENTKVPQWQCSNVTLASCMADPTDDITTGTSVTCSECLAPARDFLRCTLAKTGVSYTEPSGFTYSAGIRDPEIDAYAVTIYAGVSDEVRGIFNTYATKYFELANASNLTPILEDIFNDIVTGVSNFRLRRIIPSPAP